MAWPPTLPAEVPLTDIERDLIDNEPPGVFPENQDSYWGQFRKVIADWMQANGVDLFTRWYNNLDPRIVDENDIDEWEHMTGTPAAPAGFTIEQRRPRVQLRLYRGPFTRAQRAKIVESFIIATFGPALSFGTEGITLGSGVSLFSGATSLAGTYNIVEDVGNFSYDVRILDTIVVDEVGLRRELDRITPGHFSYTITYTATP